MYTEVVGMGEQVFIDSMKKKFVSRGDKFRNKMEAAGLSTNGAVNVEIHLVTGKLVVIARN